MDAVMEDEAHRGAAEPGDDGGFLGVVEIEDVREAGAAHGAQKTPARRAVAAGA